MKSTAVPKTVQNVVFGANFHWTKKGITLTALPSLYLDGQHKYNTGHHQIEYQTVFWYRDKSLVQDRITSCRSHCVLHLLVRPFLPDHTHLAEQSN